MMALHQIRRSMADYAAFPLTVLAPNMHQSNTHHSSLVAQQLINFRSIIGEYFILLSTNSIDPCLTGSACIILLPFHTARQRISTSAAPTRIITVAGVVASDVAGVVDIVETIDIAAI